MLIDKIKLEQDEKILVQTRRHWFILVGQLFSLVVALIAPPILWVVIDTNSITTFIDIESATIDALALYVYGLWFMFIWIGLFTIWTNYYLDVLTLTDRRVLLMNQKGFFRRNVASFRLERLQDMNIEINGFIATMLDFGRLQVETAGHSDEEFDAADLPHPRELKAAILEASDNLLRNQERYDKSGL